MSAVRRPARGAVTVSEALELAAQRLGPEAGRAEARFLVAGVLGLAAGELALKGTGALAPAERGALARAIRRRRAGEPLAYVLGTAAFREIQLAVDPRVLIPRPETERLVEAVMGLPVGADAPVLEVGTGSGAIALSLLHERRFRSVVATDISARALEVARSNAAALGLQRRVDLRLGDTYDPVGPGERYELVVSNPPYIAEAERAALPPEVREFEPPAGLYAGDGLAMIRRLVRGAPAVLVPGGWLALEFGATQATAVRAELLDAGLREVRILPDLAGRDRIALGRRAGTVP
ncbi:MAG TPA: peptide chain release factor N(5)-glutamine methyltransferase [Longimicrobiales bacterium]|nr:peptide chain release factor N(5)-glutamine methyltransferase [Longimicrobiales bacterium]